MEDFKITTNMTKKELIEKYSKLFNAYQKKLKEAEEAQKWRSQAERLKEEQAVKRAKDTTVDGVLSGVAELRKVMTKALDDMAQRLSSQAERLQELNKAIEVQERRLKELYDIEAASENLSKLIAAYDEEKQQVVNEMTLKIATLEEEYRKKHEELKREIEEETSRWEQKRQQLEKEYQELKISKEKEWK